MDRLIKKIHYEQYEHITGTHKLKGTKIDSIWWNIHQYQLVNGNWTEAGCNWFKQSEIRQILDESGELVDSGEGELKEFTDDPELKGQLIAITTDEYGNDVFL